MSQTTETLKPEELNSVKQSLILMS